MESETKTCPVCGSPARVARKSGVTGVAVRSRFYRERVICKNKRCELQTKEFKRPGQAVAAWNQRAPEPTVGEALEALRAVKDMVENCADAPTQPDCLPAMVLAHVNAALTQLTPAK